MSSDSKAVQMANASRIQRLLRRDGARQPTTNPAARSAFATTLAIACLFVVLLAIAGVIVVSLIPTYLLTRSVTYDSTRNAPTFDAYYATNLTGGSSLAVTNMQSLNEQLTAIFNLPGRSVSAKIVQFIDPISDSRRKRAVNQSPNSPRFRLSGDRLHMRFSVSHKRDCNSNGCKQRSTSEADNTIRNVATSFTLKMSFNFSINVTMLAEYISLSSTDGACRLKPQKSYSTGAGSFPRSVIVSDINGDGAPDIVVTNTAADNATVLLNGGTGTFLLQPNVPSFGGLSPYSVTAADLNNDGRQDLAVANYEADSIGLLLNQGNNKFNAQVRYSMPTGSSPRSISAADVNNDGRPDLVVANSGSDEIAVFLNNGNGIFANRVSYALSVGAAPYSVALGDVNGDGKVDIVVANSGAHNAAVLLNTGNGAFASSVPYSTGANSSPRSVALADVNNDGQLDIVVANTLAENVAVLLNLGTGAFAAATTYSTGAGSAPSAVVVGDMNNDGKVDIVVANYGADTVGVLFQSVGGLFAKLASFTTGSGSSPSSVAVADVNVDGQLDIVVANYGADNVGVLLGC